MFKDDDAANSIDEMWAFMPKEFIENINPLRQNLDSTGKIYGIDGLITSHIIDSNGDGVVNENDKVWLFFGYRRGGNSYYAMDITDPSNPEVMWIIKGGSGDFVELGQTWSQPKVIYSQLNVSGSTAKPTLIFGGGYDIVKDSRDIGGQAGADSKGKAIFMVDAETGALIWSLSASGDTNFSGNDSIPSSIASLDSDGDGFTDRLYAGDTGGNLWRVDMPGSDKRKFSVFKLASLGNADEGSGTHSNDRRFFSEPDIVRAYITETIDTGKNDDDGKAIIVQQDIPYDAILIGSGDKTNPLNTNNDDAFFMIKDVNIRSRQFTSSTMPSTPSSIKINDLADYTDNPFGDVLTTQEREALALQVSLKSGWFIDLNLPGEKSTASSITINNQVNFTTYTPPSEVGGVCEVINGQGWLYRVDLALGINKYNSSYDGTDDDGTDDDGTDDDGPDDPITGRRTFISEQFLDKPTLVVTEDGGKCIVGRKLCEDGFKVQTLRTYLYVEEEQ
jgi:type IV pilus assembly protein PilY1